MQYDLPTIEYFSDKYQKLTCISPFQQHSKTDLRTTVST